MNAQDDGTGVADRAVGAASETQDTVVLGKLQDKLVSLSLPPRVSSKARTIDMGAFMARPLSMPLMPSASKPPWMRDSNRGPRTGWRDASELAVMSPMTSSPTER